MSRDTCNLCKTSAYNVKQHAKSTASAQHQTIALYVLQSEHWLQVQLLVALTAAKTDATPTIRLAKQPE
jgi:hypothetical protein